MAFVSQTDRGITKLSKSFDLLGPGCYNPILPQQRNCNNYAPFWSTSTRDMRKLDSGPGPTTYSSPHSGWHHSLTTYSNSNNIIIKLNSLGSPPFQSKIPRFPNDNNLVPGPCDYSIIQPQYHKDYRKPRVKSNKLFNADNNAPSIAKVTYLSERRAKTEEKEQPIISESLSKKGVLAGVWGKDKCKRFTNKCLTEGIGPGTYDIISQNERKGKKGVIGSNSFVSNTVRTFDTIVYDAKNMETLVMRQMEDYRKEIPAPGSYNIGNNIIQPSKYKNRTFMSTGKRFQRSKTEETVPFYEVDRAFQVQDFHKKRVPFNSESKKVEDASKEVLPGPGYYTISHRASFMARRSIESFGTTAKRSLDEPKGNDKLGPGCYEPTFAKVMPAQKWSIFASKQARPFQVTLQADKNFATYQLGKGDISHKVLQQKIHRENLEKISSGKPAFDRQTPRFKHYQEEQKRVKLTSQQLEHLMRERREEQRGKGIQQARTQAIAGKTGTMGHCQRFKEKKSGPGVGDYALRTNWTKKSYNIKYSIDQ